MRYYLFSVCMLYPASIVGGVLVDTVFPKSQPTLPPELVQAAKIYFVIGIIVLLIDLWRSRRVSDDDKIWWTAVLFIFCFLLAPLYWFMVVNKEETPTAQSQ